MKIGPFYVDREQRLDVGWRVLLDRLARRDACEIDYRIDPAEVLKGDRRQLPEARRIGQAGSSRAGSKLNKDDATREP